MVSNIFYFHPYLGKWSNLTNLFQRGWNHQRDFVSCFGHVFFPESWCSCPPLTEKMNKWQSPKSRVSISFLGNQASGDIFNQPKMSKIRANYGKFVYGYVILPKSVHIKYLIGWNLIRGNQIEWWPALKIQLQGTKGAWAKAMERWCLLTIGKPKQQGHQDRLYFLVVVATLLGVLLYVLKVNHRLKHHKGSQVRC